MGQNLTEGSITSESYKYAYYDMKKKGDMAKIITNQSKGGVIKAYLYFSKYDVTNFSKLKGYIIYAYPQFRKVQLDPVDPETWGTHKSIITNDIPVEKLNLPKSTKGYLMDSACNADTSDNNSYSYTNVGRSNVFPGDSLIFSVYCYVSKNFNGTWARICTEGLISEKDEYNLTKKGTWQRLTVKQK